VLKKILPARPLKLEPVKNLMYPEFPIEVLPVDNVMDPETPIAPALAVNNLVFPLEVNELHPLVMVTSPPDRLVLALVDPPTRFIDEAWPELAPPTEKVILPPFPFDA
jgi:hypothetical protein